MPEPFLRPWAGSPVELEAVQTMLGAASPAPWSPEAHGLQTLAACFVCFRRPAKDRDVESHDHEGERRGVAGEMGWAAAMLWRSGKVAHAVAVSGTAGFAYDPGHLALREGPLLEAALRALPGRPEAVLVNATGRDHPRRAGLALQLGERLGLPSLGVTNRLLVAAGDWPADAEGAVAPFHLGGEVVGYWLRVRPGVRPLAVHAGWRTNPGTALAVVQACARRRARTPEPLRAARRAARESRELASNRRL